MLLAPQIAAYIPDQSRIEFSRTFSKAISNSHEHSRKYTLRVFSNYPDNSENKPLNLVMFKNFLYKVFSFSKYYQVSKIINHFQIFQMSSKANTDKNKPDLNSFAKSNFNESVKKSRETTGRSIEYFSFNENRLKYLTDTKTVKQDSSGIVYWMSREHRVQDNWSLLYAQQLALKHNLPLQVVFIIKDCQEFYPCKRQLKFLLEGLEFVKKECEELNIGFYVLNCALEEFADVIKKNNVGAVCCDFNPLRKAVENVELVIKYLPEEVLFVQIDSRNIVPVWITSQKQEYMAKTIRPKILAALPEFFTEFPSVCKHEYKEKLKSNYIIEDLQDVIKIYKPKYDVDLPEISQKAGPEQALEVLKKFIVNALQYYGINSNDPTANTTSQLSAWIHFGHISSQRIALEVKKFEPIYKKQVEKFLEELIIRKEPADNYCTYNENYDNIDGALDWAKQSLLKHKQDKRPYIYSKSQLEKAETKDECWNAAQLQAVREGEMHGYMRMYWCKKILEWTKTPEEAIEISIYLNDVYNLDGTDPNGYVGIMWSICGVHDQGWSEREIFGKIRCMVQSGLLRKYDMDAYCGWFGRQIDFVEKPKKKLKSK